MEMKDTLKYRNAWIGLAMIWIVLYHADFRIPFGILGYLKGMGYGGVDICIFASGIGCFHSLEKNPDMLDFLKRRIIRLVPTYWIFLIIWFGSRIFMQKFSLSFVLGNVLGVQTLTGQGNDFNWYISALVVLYLLAPLMKKMIDRIHKNFHFLLVLIFLLLLSIAYWDADRLIIMMTRIPVFYLGMVYAKKCCEGRRLEKHVFWGSALGAIVGSVLYFVFQFYFADYLWKFGLYWYPFILIAPGICIIFSGIMMKMENSSWCRKLVNVLENIGNYSFEIYLVHILFFEVIGYCIEELEMIENTNLIWLLGCVFVIMGCVILRRLVKIIEAVRG